MPVVFAKKVLMSMFRNVSLKNEIAKERRKTEISRKSPKQTWGSKEGDPFPLGHFVCLAKDESRLDEHGQAHKKAEMRQRDVPDLTIAASRLLVRESR
jgi:hypothetical protein